VTQNMKIEEAKKVKEVEQPIVGKKRKATQQVE
jgi:hypothetical protein